MTSPSGTTPGGTAPGGSFGRTLEDLFTAVPGPGRVPLSASAVLVEVPDLTGRAVDSAQQDLRNLRLVPRVLLVETSGTENSVKSQDPPRGSFVRPGGQVTLYVIVAREPTPTEQMVEAVRQAIKPEELAKTTDVQKLATRQDLQNETAALEKEAAASKRFEELKGLLGGQSGKPTSAR